MPAPRHTAPTAPTDPPSTWPPDRHLAEASARGHDMSPFDTDDQGRFRSVCRRACRLEIIYHPDPTRSPGTTTTCVNASVLACCRRRTVALARANGHGLGPWHLSLPFGGGYHLTYQRSCRRCGRSIAAVIAPYAAADGIPLERDTGGTGGTFPCRAPHRQQLTLFP